MFRELLLAVAVVLICCTFSILDVQDHFFVFVLEVAANELLYSICSFAAWFCLFLTFEVFSDDDSGSC